jgi:hypothetical protein
MYNHYELKEFKLNLTFLKVCSPFGFSLHCVCLQLHLSRIIIFFVSVHVLNFKIFVEYTEWSGVIAEKR